MATSSHYKRYTERLRSLIDEGNRVAKLATRHGLETYDIYIGGKDVVQLQAWLGKVDNILATVFGPGSTQNRHFREVLPGESLFRLRYEDEIWPIIGVLEGALDDLEHGFLVGQEFITAGAVFGSVLEQAEHLNSQNYKDPAAVLGRVVVEDALRRIAAAEGIDDSLKASQINDELKKRRHYSQPQWRLIQSWLDVGNAAAHGNFADYNQQQVGDMLQAIAQFLAVEFRT